VSETTLAQLESDLRLTGLAAELRQALEGSADPERALSLATDVLRVAGESGRLREVWKRRPRQLARIVSLLGGVAPFLMSCLIRHPDWLTRLAEEELEVARTAEAYASHLAEAVAATPASDREQALRRFKYYELARITLRELSRDLVAEDRVVEILAELSHLADVLLDSALACAAARLESSHGPPRWRDAEGAEVVLTFCVLALGKLGGEELNYSSDVDLVYVFQSPEETVAGAADEVKDGPRGLSPTEYFTRLARELGRIVTETTAEGFLYRIDLDLRPEGSQGPLVVSNDMLVSYYELWAATWERAAFMKARPVAGDLALGWGTIRAIDPIIYRSATDYSGVAAIRAMKVKVEEATSQDDAAVNVKTGPGGIRDVEFVAQALQLLHGGRMPQVRGRSTLGALQALAEVGVLPKDDAAELSAAYRFLRRVEHRLQMEAERQTHTLPAGAAARERLALSMGFSSAEAFEEALTSRRRRVRQMFAAVFPEGGSEAVLGLFTRNAPHLFRRPATIRLVEDLAASFARAIAASADPQRALNNLERFIRGVGMRPFYYELLLDRPELVPRLTALFATSEYLSAYFANHPRLIEPIFSDPNVLLLTRGQLAAEYAAIRTQLTRESEGDDVERELAALRLFHHRALVNVGLLDLGGKVTLAEAERSLTEVAEVCVGKALELAETELLKRAPAPEAAGRGGFLVVGMGKLASRELMYGSDLDVIFLYDVAGGDAVALIEAQEYYVRLAQKLIWALQARTRDGVCYDIDARLRPSGNQGMLVTSLAGFEQYHAERAQVWERQALLRARSVAGHEQLANSFEALRLRILSRPLPAGAGVEVHRVRLRMERELARETKSRHDFKAGRGGLLDVENVVQFLQLEHGAAYPELLRVETIADQLVRLARLGLLEAGDAETLQRGWGFLQRLSSRLRIVENRSISDLDEERGDLDALARRLGYAAPQRETGARRALLEDYRRHTTAIREVYLRVLGVE
jgi:glutamate-ammonia-ligase adenylyltransferase